MKIETMVKGMSRTRLVALGCSVAIACAAAGSYLLYHRPTTIDAGAFADEALRTTIMESFDVDGDGSLSSAEAEKVTSLVVHDATVVSGLDVFPNLRALVATGDALTTVDVDGTQALLALDVSGSPNLTSLRVHSTLSLQAIDLRGTAVTELDLSQSGHVRYIFADPGVTLKGVYPSSTVETDVPLHFEQAATGEGRESFVCDATYDDQTGVLLERSLTGDVTADVAYTYEDGLLTSVDVTGTRGRALDNQWSLAYATGRIDATGGGGSYLRRAYDAHGRLETVSVNVPSMSGQLSCEMTLGYDARGYVSTLDLVSEQGSRHYDIHCNGEAAVEAISWVPVGGGDASGGGNADGDGSDGDGDTAADNDALPAATVQFLSANIISGINMRMINGDMSSGESAAGRWSGIYYGEAGRTEEGRAYQVVGQADTYETDEGLTHYWGSIAAFDNSWTLTYDGDFETINLPADHFDAAPAVSLWAREDPSYVVDYWLVDDVDSLVRVVVNEAASRQWSLGSTDPALAVVNADRYANGIAAFEGALSTIAAEQGISEEELQYGLCWQDSMVMAVTDTQHPDAALALYTLVGGKPVLVCQAEKGGSVELCGDGYVREVGADGDLRVSRFNGISLDFLAGVEDGLYSNVSLGIYDRAATQDDLAELDRAYPSAMPTLRWQSPVEE